MLGMSALQQRPAVAGRLHFRAGRAGAFVVRAEKKEGEQKKQDGKPTAEGKPAAKPDRQVDAALANLRTARPEVARQVLKAWKDAGVTDAKGVRAQFYKAGLSSVAVASIQTLFDAVATIATLQTAAGISAADFPLHGFVAYLVYTLSFYFAFGVILDLFTIGATVTSTVVLGTKADTVLQAVEELAGKSGIAIVDKAQQAVNTGKIVLALNSIATALKDGDQAKPSMQTLDRLSALMTLKDAEEKYGFSASKYGVDDTEAARIALRFSTYDTNSDCKLEYSEFKRLCGDSTFELTDVEAKVAMQLLDKDNNGYIDFDEYFSFMSKSSEERAREYKQQVSDRAKDDTAKSETAEASELPKNGLAAKSTTSNKY